MTDLPPTYRRKPAVAGSDLLPDGYRTSIIRDYSEFLAIKNNWNDLLEQNFVATVWMRHEWIDSWWQAFGGDMSLFIPTLKRDGKIIGIIPMMIEITRIKGVRLRVLKFIENGITPRSNIIMPGIGVPEVSIIWKKLEECSDEWDVAFLENLAQDNPGYKCFLRFLTESGTRFVESPDRISPYIQLQNGWEQCHRNFGKRLRRNISNARNRLKQQGEFSLVECKTPAEVNKALEICYGISRRSWKGELGKDIGGRTDRKTFYDKITETGIRNGWVTIWLLRLNEEFIAFEYTLQLGSEMLLLAVDYDQAHNHFSPGTVLRSLVLERIAARNAVSTYDLAGTNYDYKLHWTKSIRPHSQFWVFNDRIKSRLLYFIKAKILERFKKAPPRPDIGDGTQHAEEGEISA